jgi:two-component system sensor histidine kinase UhpB
LESVDVSPEGELVIYRVAQEGLTNVARHAQASSVAVELREVADAVVLTVADDGRGIGEHDLSSRQGIRGMRERALLVGATLSIESRPDAGTTVRLSLPREVDL